jgi:histidyl-tRNA synthetase
MVAHTIWYPVNAHPQNQAINKMAKPAIPQGTRDFGPETVRKRNYIFDTIRHVFELYGFQPLETPAMENIETLMGKYGDEGDKLIFKILNNGLNAPEKKQASLAAFENVLLGKTDKNLTERALRYDLTIPFARYVAMHHGQLTFPFKRYQVQPVWRADRPQRGRYREFYQCDADVVGSISLLNEVELAALYAEVFRKLRLRVEIKINNRKILAGLAEWCGGAEKMLDISIAIDKLDKIGLEKVKEELSERGFAGDQISIIEKYLTLSGTNEEKLSQLTSLLGEIEILQTGIHELNEVLSHSRFTIHDSRLTSASPAAQGDHSRFTIDDSQLPSASPAAQGDHSRFTIDDSRSNTTDSLTVDLTLARGLNYYTGIIFEVSALDAKMGSIGGGGRYDDLTGLFGVPNIPGVGISFGVDRIYDVMDELKLFPAEVHTGTQVLFFNLGNEESRAAFQLLRQLRENDVRSEIYHEAAKFDKQFKYAEKKNIPFIVIIGTKELEQGVCTVKDLRNGVQQSISFSNLPKFSFI